MCGICGEYSSGGGVAMDAVLRMRDTMVHRGPDGEGAYLSPGEDVGLGHRRLSIIDPEGGAQPMRSACGRYVLVFNGEIYNYVELRRELEGDYPFATRSDSEVLLALIASRGLEGLTRLNGMFAFALYDEAGRTLTLARDPLGIKPLYVAEDAGRLLFASEIKAVLAHGSLSARPNMPGVADYLTFQYTLGDKTMFRGIRKFPPGTWMTAGPDGVRKGRYFDFPDAQDGLGFDEASGRLEELLTRSVGMQLRSDVPLGTHLSGGLDTGLIASMASQRLPAGLDAFSAGFGEGGVFDDTGFASLTADRVGARLHAIYPGREEFVELLPRLLRHMDEPAAGEGLFPQYCVSRLAADTVKVVLGGQGADELLGGYTRYYLFMVMTAVARGVRGDSPLPGAGLADLEPMLPQLRSYWPLWSKVLSGDPYPEDEALYFRMISRCPDLGAVLSEDAMRELDGYSPYREFCDLFREPDTDDPLSRLLRYECTQWLPALLQVEDRMSMACSLESRVPFLDADLIRFAFTMPGALKMRGGLTKSLLRPIAARRLPASIHERRDKVGFPVPVHSWGLGQMLKRAGAGAAGARGLFNERYVASCGQGGGAGDRRLWGMLCLLLWWKNSFERG